MGIHMGQTPSPARIAWIDNLRTLMIVLVVNMHACVTYSHVGGWYRMEDPEPAMPVKIAFILWQGHLQAFFMGLLFFLAGVFAHRSLERRGAGAFLKERGRRLGLVAGGQIDPAAGRGDHAGAPGDQSGATRDHDLPSWLAMNRVRALKSSGVQDAHRPKAGMAL